VILKSTLHAHGQGNFGALLKSTAKKKLTPLQISKNEFRWFRGCIVTSELGIAVSLLETFSRLLCWKLMLAWEKMLRSNLLRRRFYRLVLYSLPVWAKRRKYLQPRCHRFHLKASVRIWNSMFIYSCQTTIQGIENSFSIAGPFSMLLSLLQFSATV